MSALGLSAEALAERKLRTPIDPGDPRLAAMTALGLGLSADQIALRRKYVCSSDAAEVMKGSWRELWKIKTGAIEEPDLYDKLSPELDFHVLRHFTRERLELTRLLGHATEPLNAFWYEKQTGRVVDRRSEWIISADYPFMAGNLDGVSTASKGDPCYWDAKWTGRADEAFVLRHTPQGVHNATILGFDWWGLSVFIGNGKWEWIEQPVDPLYQARLIAAEREFWGYVERGEEPEDRTEPALPPKPQPKLRQILLDITPDAEKPNWSNDFIRLARQFAETKPAADLHAITRREMDALVPEDVGLCKVGLVSAKRDGRGFSVTLDKQGKSDG